MSDELQKIERINCPTCATEFETSFCPNCGERRLTEKDHSAKSLVTDFFGEVFSIDNTFYRTIKKLIAHPADYAEEYIQGARKKFISPIKIFLIANAYYFVFPASDTFRTTLYSQLNRQKYSDSVDGLVLSFIEWIGYSYNDFAPLYDDLTNIISKLILIILPVTFGVLTWLINIEARKEKTLVQHLNYAFIFYSFFLSVVVSILPGTYKLIAITFNINSLRSAITEMNLTIYVFLVLNTYGIYLYRKFFSGKPFVKIAKLVALNFTFLPMLIYYRFLLLWITLGWIWITG